MHAPLKAPFVWFRVEPFFMVCYAYPWKRHKNVFGKKSIRMAHYIRTILL